MRGLLPICAAVAVAACGPAGGPTGTKVRLSDSGLTAAGPDGGTRTSSTADAGLLDAGSADAGAGCPTPSLAAIREQVFLPRCASNDCHGGGQPAANLDLRPGGAQLRTRLLERSAQSPSGLALVAPGDAASSYLYLKVFLRMPVTGDPMPPAEPLASCEIAAIRDWIKNGAADD